jgi:hypothetical protein
MPYWSVFCVLCRGYIADALLECLPPAKFDGPEGKLLRADSSGVALACPYCGGLIGFNANRQLIAAPSGWPVLRYSRAKLEEKKTDDGEPAQVSVSEWALRVRFDRPGSHRAFESYRFAEEVADAETVP